MESIFSSVITPGMAGLAVTAIAIMLFVGRIPVNGSRVNKTKFWKNWGEFILVVLCISGSFAPGVNNIPKSEWGSVLVFGGISALVAHLGRKILKPIIINKIEGKNKGV